MKDQIKSDVEHGTQRRIVLLLLLMTFGALIVTKAVFDSYRMWADSEWMHIGWHFANVIGVIFGARLIQQAIFVATHRRHAVSDMFSTSLACLWMPATALSSLQSLGAWSWCVPTAIIMVLLAPSWTVWIVSSLNTLTVGAASIFQFGSVDALQITLVMGGASLSCAYFRVSTERVQRCLAERLAHISLALRSTSAGTVEWDAKTNSCSFSDRFMEVLGYSAWREMPTKDFFDYVHPEDRIEIRQSVAMQLKEAMGQDLFRMRSYDYRLIHRTGAPVWIHTEAYVLGDETGVERIVCTVVDISDAVRIRSALDSALREIQRQVQKANERAEEMQRAIQLRQQLEVLVRSSHQQLVDMLPLHRDPAAEHDVRALSLNALQARATWTKRMPSVAGALLIDENTPSIAVDAIGAAITLSEKVTTFLDFRAMEEGRFQCELVDVNLASLVSALIAGLGDGARRKCISPVVQQPTEFLHIKAHVRLCSLCLESALGHALELAPAGTLVAIRPRTDGHPGLTIDTDVYLEPSHLREMLNLAKTDVRQSKGVPTMHEVRLGIQAMGGRLVVSSSRAQGTRFGFEFLHAATLKAAVVHSESYEQEFSLSRSTLLFATDDPWIFQHAALRFEDFFEVRALPRLTGAIDAFVSKRFEVVVLCPTLEPEAQTLVGRMRKMQQAAFEEESLFVALLPSVDSGDLIRKAGFDQLLTVPLQSNAMVELVRAIQRRRVAELTAPWVEAKIVNAYPDYIASRKQLVAKLATAVRAGENDAAGAIAHTLIGSPGLHGFDASLAICRKIEYQADEVSADPTILGAIDQLARLFENALVR